MIYTNLDTNNMINELRVHFKGVNNKNYIKECIDTHHEYKLITGVEKDVLYKEYLER